MEQENKNNNKKVAIIVSAIITIIAFIIISIFIYDKINWKGYETYKTDQFSIKYKDSWKVEKIPSDLGFAVTFSDSIDTLNIVLCNKENAPDDQNTLEKLKNNVLKQLEDFEEYLTEKPIIQSINKSNIKGFKITASCKVYFQSFEFNIVIIEKDDYLCTLFFKGENVEIFDKIYESFKIK